MLEIEAKFPCPDRGPPLARLAAWGARELPAREESDTYLNAPDRDFARTGEALRVRRAGDTVAVTYKGPRLPGAVKTRAETELAFAPDVSASDAVALLTSLGYRVVADVRKTRRLFELRRDGFDVTVCLDDVAGVGVYAEVEILGQAGDVPRAQGVLLALAADLGLGEQEPRSYLRMWLENQPEAPVRETETRVLRTVAEVRAAVADARRAGKRIGLVPTMGALHEGHAALVDAARRESDFVVVSVFVNPTQFAPHEDFTRYPRTLETDVALCAAHGAAVFAPEPGEVYPEGATTFVEVAGLSQVMEGAARPGHFRGVATVVLKLFEVVQPDVAIFGQKDAQQCAVIRALARDLLSPVRIRIEPTVREPDGLAMSSRNRYLSPEHRAQAVVLSRALADAQTAVDAGERDPLTLERRMAERIADAPDARLDYARVVDARTFEPLTTLDRPAVAVLAVFLGTTRLIDNAPLSVPEAANR